jgi:hypothetical protein
MICLPPPKRHYYEMIWERRPCHLYFDIEFCRWGEVGQGGAGWGRAGWGRG